MVLACCRQLLHTERGRRAWVERRPVTRRLLHCRAQPQRADCQRWLAMRGQGTNTNASRAPAAAAAVGWCHHHMRQLRQLRANASDNRNGPGFVGGSRSLRGQGTHDGSVRLRACPLQLCLEELDLCRRGHCAAGTRIRALALGFCGHT